MPDSARPYTPRPIRRGSSGQGSGANSFILGGLFPSQQRAAALAQEALRRISPPPSAEPTTPNQTSPVAPQSVGGEPTSRPKPKRSVSARLREYLSSAFSSLPADPGENGLGLPMSRTDPAPLFQNIPDDLRKDLMASGVSMQDAQSFFDDKRVSRLVYALLRSGR